MTTEPLTLSEIPTLAALLAGGSSRRMGTDKGLSQLGGKPLAHWSAATLAAVSRTRAQIGGAPLPGLGWKVLEDLRPGCGPAAGLETALACFPGAIAVVCAVDTPFVPPALLRHAAAKIGTGVEAALPRTEGRWHPLVGAYSPAILPSLTAWLESGRFRLQTFLDRRHVAALEGDELEQFGDPEVSLMNVNSKADLARAEDLLSGAEFL